jgi:hypothetical protein
VLASSGSKGVTSHPALIEKKHLLPDGTVITTTHGFYEQFLNGNWIGPRLLGQLPNPGGKPSPSDFADATAEQHRLWQVWIQSPIDSPTLEIEVKYPPGCFSAQMGGAIYFGLRSGGLRAKLIEPIMLSAEN